MPEQEGYLEKINEWEYCYCRNCGRIRYVSDLEATERGIRCCKCGSYDLEVPGWVHCPHDKVSTVKCPRAGKGIVHTQYGDACEYRCVFRKT